MALRTSNIVATNSDSFPRCVLRCRGSRAVKSDDIASANRSIPPILAPPLHQGRTP
ncbi:hypothetical protein MTBSS4_1270001 [Magnetospirillum sp. SS-4]|nr:hypothetical protein MTBSS4_1270001 [Magnetospirillum sp. SS-4]